MKTSSDIVHTGAFFRKGDLAALLDKVHRSKGWDFRGYKPASLKRRISKRLTTLRIGSVSEYLLFLDTDHSEYFRLFSHMTLKVSEFFREPEVFEALAAELKGARGLSRGARAWCCGVAHGQEAYSLAILLSETIGAKAMARTNIFATDIDHAAVDDAREALYRAESVQNLERPVLNKYFTRRGEMYEVKDEIRNVVKFGVLDIVKNPPLSRIDIVFCRNLFIYFNKKLQAEVFSKLDYALSPGGLMVLGNAETIPARYASMYEQVGAATRIFRKKRE